MFLGQGGDEPVERAPLVLGRRSALGVRARSDVGRLQHLLAILRERHGGAALLLMHRRRVAVAHDSQEPRLHISIPKPIETTKSAQERLLHDVIRLARGAPQPARKAVRGVKVRYAPRLEARAFLLQGGNRMSLASAGPPRPQILESRPNGG